MRNAVRKALAPALNDSSLSGLDLDPYRRLLADPYLRFVVFVDAPATSPPASGPTPPAPSKVP